MTDKMKPEATRSMTRAEMEALTKDPRAGDWSIDDLVWDLKGALKQLLEETRWIPVSERLPFLENPVLVWLDRDYGEYKEHAFVGHYHANYGWWIWIEGDWMGIALVTHWMPLPKAPEE